jgi:hypothetical protein
MTSEEQKRAALAIGRVGYGFINHDKEADKLCLKKGFLEKDGAGFAITEKGIAFHNQWHKKHSEAGVTSD